MSEEIVIPIRGDSTQYENQLKKLNNAVVELDRQLDNLQDKLDEKRQAMLRLLNDMVLLVSMVGKHINGVAGKAVQLTTQAIQAVVATSSAMNMALAATSIPGAIVGALAATASAYAFANAMNEIYLLRLEIDDYEQQVSDFGIREKIAIMRA